MRFIWKKNDKCEFMYIVIGGDFWVWFISSELDIKVKVQNGHNYSWVSFKYILLQGN